MSDVGSSVNVVSAGWMWKDEPTVVEVERGGEWLPGLLYGWRQDEVRGWVAHVRYSQATEWGRGNHVDVVPAARVRQPV
jgi:hypothetical protein